MKSEKAYRGGCPHCPGTNDLLEMDTVLYNGFGGYVVMRNADVYYVGDPNDEWDNYKTLSEIEIDARKEPNETWVVKLDLPLRDAKWERRGLDKWELVESGLGFA
jgi:hypothetical protein